MNEWADMRLLQEYAEHGTEAVFTVLVGRHLAMVYQASEFRHRQRKCSGTVWMTEYGWTGKLPADAKGLPCVPVREATEGVSFRWKWLPYHEE